MYNDSFTNMMGAMGRGGDTMMAHVSPGDVVIPRDIVLQNPEFLTKFKKVMQGVGGDYRSHVMGSGYENRNPETNAPEFNLNLQKLVDSGRVSAADLPRILSKLWGSSRIKSLPHSLGNLTKEFKLKRPDEGVKPFDLFSRDVGGQQFNTLDPTQQRSFLATEGSYGSGLSDEDNKYYMNMLQRNLLDENGQLGNINTALLPIERNYLSRLGLPTDDTAEFFKALQN